MSAGRERISGAYVTIDGISTAWESCGDGRAIVCVHTAGMDSTQWRWVLPAFADAGYRAIAVDLPGHGKSDVPPDGPIASATRYADFLASFCRELDLDDVRIVGCSVGGDVALAFAAGHPGLAAACVACEAASVTGGLAPLLLRMASESAGAPGWNDMFAFNSLACVGEIIPEERLRHLEWAHLRASRIVANQDLIAWNTFDLTAKLDKIECPTLVIYGDRDYFVVRERAVSTAEAISNAEFVELENVGHYPMVEDPDFASKVLAFFRTVDLPGRNGGEQLSTGGDLSRLMP